jgi:predicted RND superfamily exporter protein
VTTETMNPDVSDDFLDALRDDLHWMSPPPGTTATLTGGEVLYAGVFDALTTGRYRMTFTGLLFIFVALLAVYRDWFKAMIPVLPVVLVTGLSGGMMYVFGMKYTSVSATMGALIIGLGLEYFLPRDDPVLRRAGQG